MLYYSIKKEEWIKRQRVGMGGKGMVKKRERAVDLTIFFYLFDNLHHISKDKLMKLRKFLEESYETYISEFRLYC